MQQLFMEHTPFGRMNKFYCPLPFLHYGISTDAKFRACCESREIRTCDINKVSSLDFINSIQQKNLRDAFLSEDPTSQAIVSEVCDACITKESQHKSSKRLREIKATEQSFIRKKFLQANTTLHKAGKKINNIESVHIQGFGSFCNLMCVMCGSNKSSTWAEFLKNDDINLIDFFKGDNNKQKFFKSFLASAKHIQRITFSGGEPLIQKEILQFLDFLKDNNLQPELTFTTNGTVPVKVLNRFTYFKKVSIDVSFDGLYENLEYVRRNTVWKKWENNIKDYHSYFKSYKQWSINHFSTIHALNIKQIPIMIDWMTKNNFFNFAHRGFVHHLVMEPKCLRIKNLPDKIKNNYRKVLKGVDKKHIQDILNELDLPSDSHEFNNLNKHLDRTTHDKGWKDIWPELVRN